MKFKLLFIICSAPTCCAVWTGQLLPGDQFACQSVRWTRMCKSTIGPECANPQYRFYQHRSLFTSTWGHTLLYVENQLSVAEPVWWACDILGVQKFKQQWFKMIQSSFNKTRSKQHVLLFALTLSTESKGRTSFLIGNWMCWMCIFHVYFHVKSRSTSKQLFLK